jgi:hypothetical protein
MKSGKQFGLALTAALALSGFAGAANADVFNTSLAAPGFYNGTGGVNSGFVTNTVNGVEFGLGTINRFIGPVTPSPTNSSTYNVATGTSGGFALWNFQFSMNLQVGGANSNLFLNSILPTLTIVNVGNGQVLSFNPLVIPDNAGWNGAKNVAAANLATDYGFQNSENLSFTGFVAPLLFDPNANGTYLVTLSAKLVTGLDLGSVSETIIAGTGAETPLPAALPLFATGLGVMGVFGWRRKKKSAVTA